MNSACLQTNQAANGSFSSLLRRETVLAAASVGPLGPPPPSGFHVKTGR